MKGQRQNMYTCTQKEMRDGEGGGEKESLTPMLARKSSPPKTTASRKRPT